MSPNSKPVNPFQDLLDRVNELQSRLEDIESSIHNIRVQSQYEHVRTKIADARSAIMALVSVYERVS